MLGQYGAVLADTWWYWVSLTWYWVRITWYRLALSGTGLVQGFYACIYWKKWKFGRMLPQRDGQTNDEQGKIELRLR